MCRRTAIANASVNVDESQTVGFRHIVNNEPHESRPSWHATRVSLNVQSMTNLMNPVQVGMQHERLFSLTGFWQNSIGQESHLAIETSGHGALKENHWLDDGAYLMVKLLNKLAAAKAAGEGLGSSVLNKLIAGLEEADVAVELRLKIDQNHADVAQRSFHDYGEAVLKQLENASESDASLQKAPVNHEGVRVSGHGGWFLLRLSLHDPVLPLNIEAPSKEAASKLALAVFSTVKDFTALDISPLRQFIDNSA